MIDNLYSETLGNVWTYNIKGQRTYKEAKFHLKMAQMLELVDKGCKNNYCDMFNDFFFL
jgi:hypothetical protein